MAKTRVQSKNIPWQNAHQIESFQPKSNTADFGAVPQIAPGDPTQASVEVVAGVGVRHIRHRFGSPTRAHQDPPCGSSFVVLFLIFFSLFAFSLFVFVGGSSFHFFGVRCFWDGFIFSELGADANPEHTSDNDVSLSSKQLCCKAAPYWLQDFNRSRSMIHPCPHVTPKAAGTEHHGRNNHHGISPSDIQTQI